MGDANPKTLHFIDKIQEENALDGGQSISTNPSNSGYDLLVLNPNNTSRQNPFMMSGRSNFHTIDHKPSSKYQQKKKQTTKRLARNVPIKAKDSTEEFSHRSQMGKSDFHTKMDDFIQRKNEKLKALREEKARKELEGCQFAPNIYTRRHNGDTSRRNFEQFI